MRRNIFTWYLIKFKWYRKRKGGTWHKIWVYQFPYMSYWVQESDMLPNEIPYKTEKY